MQHTVELTFFADISELRRLIGLCERPVVKELLERQLAVASVSGGAGGESSAASGSAAASVSSATVSAAAPAPAPAPAAVPKPVPVPEAAGAGVSRAPITYTSVGYGWESNNDGFVEVTILSGLEGVGALPRENVVCDFTKTSFDLRVHGLDSGKRNARLRVPHLDKEIDPAGSKIKIGKNRVTVLLKKVNTWDYWANLAAKNPAVAKAAKAADADPTAGLMGMMKQLYDDGDDKVSGLAETYCVRRVHGSTVAGTAEPASTLRISSDALHR